MDDQVFRFRRSRFAMGIFVAAYAGTLWLLLMTMPALVACLLAGLLLPGLAFIDCKRCGLAGCPRLSAMRLRRQRWQLWLNGAWRAADIAVYYRGQLCIIVAWREPASRRTRYLVVWRDMPQPAQWPLLVVYLSLVPLTRVDTK